MNFLLSLPSPEYDGGTWERWAPLELGDNPWRETASNPVFRGHLYSGNYQLFICRECDHWPVKSNFQC